MKVIKRDGTEEAVSFDKVLTRIQYAADGLEVDGALIAQRTLARIYDGVKTSELDELAAQLSISLMTTHPDYGVLAARIAISNHHRNTSDRFTEVVRHLSTQTLPRTGEPASPLSEELVTLCKEHGPAIDARMDYDRDYLFDYFGFKTLEKLQYLMRDYRGKTVERPQHLLMRVSLALWGTQDIEKAFETYDLLSRKCFIHATPTNFNAGTPRPQLSSCYLLAMKDDSIAGIYDTLKDCALISKYAGGIGIHIHDIRAKGSLIRGTNGTSNGIVPMLRNFNATARYVDQCFTPDTLVETDTGPRPIAEVGAGDRVRSSDGQFHTVEARVKHMYSGTMFRLQLDPPTENRTEAVWVQVTKEHPLLAVKNIDTVNEAPWAAHVSRIDAGLLRPEFIEVNELYVGDYVLQSTGDARRIAAIEFTEYTGPVYDFEVEGPHDYMVTHLGVAHNGGGKRNGSFAIYLEPWHADVEDFLKLKMNTGAEEERCRDLFYALWVPDLFMERVEKNLSWSLFCPSEAPGLADVYGDAFRKLYETYEREGRARKQVSAQKLWFSILDAQIETGTPYLVYKDAANQKSNQKNLGTIRSSNLCVAPETLVYTKEHGNVAIRSVVNQSVHVWNGDQWSPVTIVQTGAQQPLVTVHLTNGFSMTCTPQHKFIVADGSPTIADASRVDASQLVPGTALRPFQLPWLEGTVELSVVRVVDEGRVDDTYCFTEPMNHAGVFNGVLTGQCSEIIEYSSPEEQAVCNLASIALPAYIHKETKAYDFDELRRVVKVAIRNLNRVIDINFYPTPETRRSNLRHRPVGLGVQGLADVFAMLKMPWESAEAADLNQRIFEHMYFAAVEASWELACTEGPYETFHGSPMSEGQFQYDLWSVIPLTLTDGSLPWEDLKERVKRDGVRNSLLLAPMPTASTSQIQGLTEAFEPITSNLYTRRTLAGEFVVVNKHLIRDLKERGLWNELLKQQMIADNGSIQQLDQIPAEIRALYKTAWEIKQKTLIDMAAARGAFICQSQSLNLFMADPDYSKLTSMHFYGWKKGLKTGIYYLRTKAPVMAQKFTVDPELQKAAALSERNRERAAAAASSEATECLMCSS